MGIVYCFLSCTGNKKQPVARAYDQVLYQEDIAPLFTEGMSTQDSVNLLQATIENWQREQVLLKVATRQMEKSHRNFSKQIEAYKNALLLHEFEQQLLRDKLDSVVTDAEIASYYKKHEGLFILDQPLFKISYIELPKNAPELARVKRWFSSPDDSNNQELLKKYCESYAMDFDLVGSTWHTEEEWALKLPIRQISERDYRKFGQIFEINEKNQLYLIILRDSREIKSVSPFELEKEKIRNLLLNQRIHTLLENEEKKIIENARKNKHLETYNK